MSLLAAFYLSLVAYQDTLLVPADKAPAWGSVPPRELYVIGSLDGPPPLTFGLITDADVSPDGTLYVVDFQVPAVRRYGPDGTYLSDLGRVGQGPGEYLQILGLEILPDGRPALWDPINQRVSIFNTDGSYSESIPVDNGAMVPEPFDSHADGRLYVKSAAWPKGSDESRLYWIRISPGLQTRDTLFLPDRTLGPSYSVITSEGVRRPFATRIVTAVAPTGALVEAQTDAYVIHYPQPTGTVLRIARQYEAISVTPAERAQWDAYTEYFEDFSRRQGRPFRRPVIPERKPPWRDLFVDSSGRIWVSVHTPARRSRLSEQYLADRRGRPLLVWRERPDWEVFSPDGSFLGRFSLPPSTRPLAARDDVLLAVRRGEWDEQYLVVYQLPG